MQHLLVFSDQSQYNELFSSLSMKMTVSRNKQNYDFAFEISNVFFYKIRGVQGSLHLLSDTCIQRTSTL